MGDADVQGAWVRAVPAATRAIKMPVVPEYPSDLLSIVCAALEREGHGR